MSEDKSLEENFEIAQQAITPSSSISGMGEVSFPDGDTPGSGDVPAVADIDDDEEEAKKDKTKKKLEMENFNLYTQFNSFVSESLVNEAFKFGKKNQYSIDDINEAYGFWGTLDVAGFRRKDIEDCWHSAMAWLTEAYKFSDPGALYYLNAKAGRWIADQVVEQKGNKDVVDVLEDYATDAEWKKWSKEYNKFAQEELAEANTIYERYENPVRDLHFETDPERAEELKIEIGISQGEVTRKKQIEGGEYSLRRFRKEIKYDETGEDLGVFKPGSYMAATSKLGDGPHEKAAKKVKWNQKMYNQWIEDVASNGGWEHAFDMAQNAKHERGLIDWVKKNYRDDDPMQRIQWDIEAMAESTVIENKIQDLDTEDMNPNMAKKLLGMASKQYKNEFQGSYTVDRGNKKMRFDTYGALLTMVKQKDSGNYGPSYGINIGGNNELEDFEGNVLGKLNDKSLSSAISSVAQAMKIAAKNSNESVVNEKSWNDVAKVMDAGLNKAIKKGITTLRYAKDYVKSLERMANKEAKKFFDEYGDFTEDDFIEDVRYNMANEKVKDYFSEWVALNEKKEDREGMMKFIKKHMSFVGTSEDFNGSQGGIHVSGENYDDEFKGKQIYDYYSEDYKNREFGVLNSWEKELNKRGWYSEWYDAGTVCIWPL
jgi:hypothetical protein